MAHKESGWVYIILLHHMQMCGCGDYDGRIVLLRDTLRSMPLWDKEKRLVDLDSPIGEWFLSTLDAAGLIEHGTSIGGSWLTPLGERLLAALNDEDIFAKVLSDEFYACECKICSTL